MYNLHKKYVRFIPSWYDAMNRPFEASFYALKNAEQEGKKLFNQLKWYIRSNYKMSNNKSYYIGKGMYQDYIQTGYYIVSLLIMVFVVNSLYFFLEVNAPFICKSPKNQGF